MLCAQCNSENSEVARYCSACGSQLARSAPADKGPGSALTPRAAKELDTPLPFAEFRQTAIQTDPGSLPTEGVPPKPSSLSTGPRPLYVKSVPTSKPSPAQRPGSAIILATWQWTVAIASGAVLLYTSSLVIAIALFWLMNSGKASTLSSQFIVAAALAGAACCGLGVALPDTKTTLTVIAGGVLLRSVLALLSRSAARFEWLLVCGVAVCVLWSIWVHDGRERGDAARMTLALTILVAGEALSAAFGIASHASFFHARELATVAVAIGTLLFLRIWLPGAIGR